MGKQVYVDISARHIHLRPEDIEVLFGPGVELTRRDKDNVMGKGVVVFNERLEIKGPKGSIKNVTILGPLRNYMQVEISATDARKLGVPAVIRDSGNHEGTPGCEIIGPHGSIVMEKGVIVAKRHIHLNDADAEEIGVKNNDLIGIKIEGTGRSLILNDVVVHTNPRCKTTVHIDTDEANAAGMKGGMMGEIVVLA